ncbi:MAG: hypothetical protein P8Z49_01725 [Acidobacteriota bacterium]|jgi:hypothetical protein
MKELEPGEPAEQPLHVHLARVVLVTFLFTFLAARIVVFLIMVRAIPDLYLFLGQTHVHHLNYGIFLLGGTGAYLIFRRPAGRALEITAALYGAGMALTFDEFGMWLHLGGSYWQSASLDAVTLLAGVFALLAFAPELARFRPHHWLTALLLLLGIILFVFLMIRSFRAAGRVLGPKLRRIESAAPVRPSSRLSPIKRGD